MHNTVPRAVEWFTTIAAAALLAACSADHTLDAPRATPTLGAATAAQTNRSRRARDNRRDEEVERLVQTLRRVTARYHDIDVAKRDNFVLLHN